MDSYDIFYDINASFYDFEAPLDLFGMVQRVRKTLYNTLAPQLSEKNNYYIYWLHVRLKQVFSWEKKWFYYGEYDIPSALFSKFHTLWLVQVDDEWKFEKFSDDLDKHLEERYCFVSTGEPLRAVEKEIRLYLYAVLFYELEREFWTLPFDGENFMKECEDKIKEDQTEFKLQNKKQIYS